MRPASVVLTGIAATAVAVVAAATVVVGTALECGGSDVSEPSGSAICESGIAGVLAYLGGGLLVALPVLGTALSVARATWRPLALACAIAAAGFIVFAFSG